MEVKKMPVKKVVAKKAAPKRVAPKRATPKAKKYKTASIGRIGAGEMTSVPFEDGATVHDILSEAGLSLDQGDEVNDEYGNPVSLSKKAEEIDYFVVKNMKNA
jgi:hypothetical protein